MTWTFILFISCRVTSCTCDHPKENRINCTIVVSIVCQIQRLMLCSSHVKPTRAIWSNTGRRKCLFHSYQDFKLLKPLISYAHFPDGPDCLVFMVLDLLQQTIELWFRKVLTLLLIVQFLSILWSLFLHHLSINLNTIIQTLWSNA